MADAQEVAEWSIVTTTGRGVLPSPRCGHTLNLTGAGDSSSRHLVVAFGETTKTKERKFFNDVYSLSNGREWTMLNIAGRVPVLPRSNHSATVFGDDLNSVFFFGGTSLHSFLDDSLILTGIGTDKPRWVPVYTAKNPNGRRGHSLVVKQNAPNEFYLFGGQRGNLVMNDLWNFDVNTGVWSELRCVGDVPPPRAFHTAFTVQNHFCVFGGMDASGLIKDTDLYSALYDAREGRWHKRAIALPASGPGAAVAADGTNMLSGDFFAHFIGAPYYKLILYGSKTTRDTLMLDIDPENGFAKGPAQTIPVANTGFQPERRNRPASALMHGDPFRLFVFGGWKVDADPPVASAGLRCLTFRVPLSDSRPDENMLWQQQQALLQHHRAMDEAKSHAAQQPPPQIKRIKLSQRPVKSRPTPSSLRSDEVGRMAMLKIRGIAESLQAESKHDDTTLAWQVITELWLQPSVHLDATHEDRSPFFLTSAQTLELIRQADAIFKTEENILNIEGPTKLFGDIHGQFDDLCRLFKAFGSPDHHIGDIEENSYVFLGDIVDRGRHGLEVLCLLLAFKIQYPKRVFLVRGNHEDSAMNKNYGFGAECMSRFGSEAVGAAVWTAFDNLFNILPLAAIVNKRILCVHGGIGRIDSINQIRSIPRPSRVEHDPLKGDPVLMDVLWSDPADSDADRGISENKARRVSVVFGADRVLEFCAANDIDVIVRAHQCVMEGYEYFARGHLITIFSATNYCGVQRNNGALLHVTDRHDHWLITPKFIECVDPPTPMAAAGGGGGAPVQSGTWVNLSQMPPSPMRSGSRRPLPNPSSTVSGVMSSLTSPMSGTVTPAVAAGPFDAMVTEAYPSLSFNLSPASPAMAASSAASSASSSLSAFGVGIDRSNSAPTSPSLFGRDNISLMNSIGNLSSGGSSGSTSMFQSAFGSSSSSGGASSPQSPSPSAGNLGMPRSPFARFG